MINFLKNTISIKKKIQRRSLGMDFKSPNNQLEAHDSILQPKYLLARVVSSSNSNMKISKKN